MEYIGIITHLLTMDPNFLGHLSTSVFGGSEIPAVSFLEKPRSAMELSRDSLMDVDILMRLFFIWSHSGK